MSSDLKRRFGKRLALLREIRNLEQHQLGRMVGKKDKYISSIETGKNFPRPDMIDKLAKALQFPVSIFFFDEDVDNNPRALRKAIDSILDPCDVKELRKHLLQMVISREK